ncbi:MAG: LamG-like jellyroll fold domain-containing protein [Capsulimonadaceae bacterium]
MKVNAYERILRVGMTTLAVTVLSVVPLAMLHAQAPDVTPCAWGSSWAGQLGDGSMGDSNVPVQVTGVSALTEVSAGGSHSLALDSGGNVWAWGDNSAGELGTGTSIGNSSVPVQVNGLAGVVEIAAGNDQSVALDTNGNVWAWGDNDDQPESNNTPQEVTQLSGVTAIASGPNAEHSLALLPGGSVWAWGSNSNGQLGDGTTTDSVAPVQVIGLSSAIAIAGGGDHSLALLSDGTVWAWGSNSNGQLGNGTTTDSSLPVQVIGLSGVIAISAGGQHSLALKSDGTVWAWGYNSDGQLGNGSTTDSSVPVQVTGLSGVTAISGGGWHSLALCADGSLWSWGYNSDGELGDGTQPNSSDVPVPVSGIVSGSAISAGGVHSLALVSPTTHVLWSNSSGALSLWNYNPAGGAYTQNTYGPYPGWTAQTIADGPDELTRVLWVSTSGAASIWSLNNISGGFAENSFGPYPGWSPQALSVGDDNTTHVLWTDPSSGAASLWNYDTASGAFTEDNFGPYPGWSATSVADGPDGMTRLLWLNDDGTASIWSFSDTTGAYTQNSFGPFPGWSAQQLSVGTDNTTHILWTNGAGGAASLWNYNTTIGTYTQNTYGPYPGWGVTGLTDSADGNAQLLWTNASGAASIWDLDNMAGTFTQNGFGPFNNWAATAISAHADDPLKAGLIHWWPLDVDGTDTIGGLDGTVVGPVAFSPGVYGQAMVGNGQTTGIPIPDSPSMQLQGPFTLSAWVDAATFAASDQLWESVLFRGDDRSGLDPVFMSINSNELIFEVDSLTADDSVAAPVSLGTFMLYTGVNNPITGEMQLYENGQLVDQNSSAITPIQNLDPNAKPGIGIGCNNDFPYSAYNFSFDGAIDDVRIYDRALSASEVQNLYNEGVASAAGTGAIVN